jgi:hypothetical protein
VYNALEKEAAGLMEQHRNQLLVDIVHLLFVNVYIELRHIEIVPSSEIHLLFRLIKSKRHFCW